MNRYLRAALAAIFAVCLVTGLIAPIAFPHSQFPAFAEHLTADPSAMVTVAPTPPTPTATAEPTPTPTPEPTPEPTPTPFANGARGDDVKAVQQRLNLWGFLTGSADGVFGPKTEAAVKKYQQYRYDQYLAAQTPTPSPEPTPAPSGMPVTTPEPTATPVPVEIPASLPIVIGSWDDAADRTVSEIQQRLTDMGLLSGRIDGKFGAASSQAIISLQAAHGLPQTGIVDETTYRVLFSLPTPDPNATATPEPTRDPSLPAAIPVSIGTHDTESDTTVAAIQQRLIDLRYLFDVADGRFGAASAQAVTHFQQLHNLPQTGIVDGVTYKALFSDAAVMGPEPTPTPYAPTGIVDDDWKADILDRDFEIYQQDVQRGSSGAEVTRLQTRLTALWYYSLGIDGQFGANTERALNYFQKRNGLPETGIADEATQRLLYSDAAVKSDRPSTPYKLVIDVSDQRVYAYEWVNGQYDRLARTMVCSTGLPDTPTPLGTWNAGGPCGRWYYFKKFDCWAQYAYRINGPYLFHSVIYSEKDTSTLRQSSVNNLGRKASHGCVRLSVEDAKWIYNNCPAGTTVTVRN